MKTISVILIFLLAAGLLMHHPAGARTPEKNRKSKKEKSEKPYGMKRKALPGIGPFSNLLLLEKSMRRREMEEKARNRNAVTNVGKIHSVQPA